VSESGLLLSRNATIEDESDDDGEEGSFGGRSKKAKADAAMTARQYEQREKDVERERARAEAAGRRQARAGRRRQDGESRTVRLKATRTSLTDPPTEGELDDVPKLGGSASQASPPPSSQPESPPPTTTQEKLSSKKVAGRKVKRLGNNQYTKHRGEAPTSAGNGNGISSPHSKKRTNTSHTSSGDEHALTNGNGNAESNSTSTPDLPLPAISATSNGNPTTATNGTGKGTGRWGKGKKNALLNGSLKATEPAELTIPGMAKNLDFMILFIHRAKSEVAADRARLGAERSPGERAEGELEAMELAEELMGGIREWQGRFRGPPPGEAVST
jgi:hypothetical protein